MYARRSRRVGRRVRKVGAALCGGSTRSCRSAMRYVTQVKGGDPQSSRRRRFRGERVTLKCSAVDQIDIPAILQCDGSINADYTRHSPPKRFAICFFPKRDAGHRLVGVVGEHSFDDSTPKP